MAKGDRTGPARVFPRRAGGKRRQLRRRTPPRARWRDVLAHEAFIPSSAVCVAFVLAMTALLGWARSQPLVPEGRIADETKVARVEFKRMDTAATQANRDLLRLNAPLVLRADELALEQIERSLRTLPQALSVAGSLEEVSPELRETFALTPEQFEAVKAEGASSESLARWETRVDRLMRNLRELPLLSRADYDAVFRSGSQRLELRRGDGRTMVPLSRAMSIETEDETALRNLERELTQMAEAAGFYGPRSRVVYQRLVATGQPTSTLDVEATAQVREAAAASAEPVETTYRPGDILYRRGERVSEAQAEVARVESARFAQHSGASRALARWGGAAGLSVALTALLLGYLATGYRRVLRKPWRFALLALVLAGASALSVWVTIAYPDVAWLAMTGPTVFVAMMLVVAYDERFSLAVGTLLAITVTAALGAGAATLLALVLGVGVAAWRLRDIRNRSDVVGAGVLTAAVLSLGALVFSFLMRPLAEGVGREILLDAALAGAGGFLAGALTLVVLPTVERVFDIVTGMTLTEWRDPRQPLLRELQGRAPGTFNHSLSVATLVEAAADAIGADSFHVYVGALYHDIGKMLKPDYFVENQQGGPNKHNKLSPAMSLLVIVGHVKDGLELAREYGLPRSLQHYIESHHGTTLVQYFYDQAVRQAEGGEGGDRPDEIEYRYPGPKPRTKEAAVLMLCDAVESAARTMAEPTPSRIGQLVHVIAQQRLMDGQFDACNLTLGELKRIEDAVAKALSAIYHGRIAYPSAETAPKAGGEPTHRTQPEASGTPRQAPAS